MNRRDLFRAVLALPVASAVPVDRPHITMSDIVVRNNKVYGNFSFGITTPWTDTKTDTLWADAYDRSPRG